jgi:thioredoxin-like negative regulator of GroEL
MSIPEKPTSEMTLLRTQEEFEVLLGRSPSENPIPLLTVIYFTAKWCNACKKLNVDEIQSVLPKANWLKCDIDLNDYTAGYCGIRSIPTFLVIREKKILGQLGDSRTEKVVEWLKRFVE